MFVGQVGQLISLAFLTKIVDSFVHFFVILLFNDGIVVKLVLVMVVVAAAASKCLVSVWQLRSFLQPPSVFFSVFLFFLCSFMPFLGYAYTQSAPTSTRNSNNIDCNSLPWQKKNRSWWNDRLTLLPKSKVCWNSGWSMHTVCFSALLAFRLF